MPKILSFGNREKKLAKTNPFKFIWEWILSLDKFTKLFLITIVLVSIATPSIVTTYLIFTSRASTTVIPGDISERSQLVTLINQYRQQNGKSVLQEDQILTNAACWKSKNMADTGFYDHNDQDGRTFGQRLVDFGMNSGEYAVENIAASDTSAQSLLDRWKISAGHNANLLSDGYWKSGIYFPLTRLGVGVAYNPNSQWKYYWTYDAASSYHQAISPLSSVSSDCSFSTVNQPPVGTTDSITNSSCRVQGWAFDPDASGTSIAIHVYRDGQAGSGAAGKPTYTANSSRPDVNSAYGISGNHGFDITFDPSGDAFDQGFFDGATHTIYVYAIDTAGGTNPLLGMTNNISRNITCSPPPTLPPHSKGDVNCDNKITSVDSLLILKTVAGIPVTNTACAGGGIDEAAAHVDGDSDIDAVDALRVLQQVALIRQIGSASFNSGFSDSDGDEIADSQETQYPCMNPNVADANADYDGDSIAGIVSMNNISEFALRTNPCVADIDRDGYKDGAEFWIGTNPNKACATGPEDIDATKPGHPSLTWPADLNTDGGIPATYNKVTLQDLTGFMAPIRRINTSPGDDFWVNGVHNQYDRRWDLVPGKGLFSKDINVQDITNLTAVMPPMFGGTTRAFNGPVCTQ